MTTYKETCSIKDEGRPFEIGLQDQVSNCPKVMGIKSACGERLGKRWNKIHQVCAEKMNESEPLMKHRKCKEVIETKLLALAWDRIWEEPLPALPDGWPLLDESAWSLIEVLAVPDRTALLGYNGIRLVVRQEAGRQDRAT